MSSEKALTKAPTKALLVANQKLQRASESFEQAKAKLAAIEARQHAKQRSREQALDSRRKICLGAYALEMLGAEGAVSLRLSPQGKSFAEWLSRKDDRALFGLPPLPSKPTDPEASNNG